jgi:hypothetical protein
MPAPSAARISSSGHGMTGNLVAWWPKIEKETICVARFTQTADDDILVPGSSQCKTSFEFGTYPDNYVDFYRRLKALQYIRDTFYPGLPEPPQPPQLPY